MTRSDTGTKKGVLTCAQPTGMLHLGNYLGTIRHWVKYLGEYECLFGVVDMHAITVPYKAADLRKHTIDCVAQYMACGLNPKQCSLFIQSHVHGHVDLAWILGCMTSLGQLERMTQFKDKAKKQGEGVNVGLLYYPVLMAADILLYNADIVPVGEDQKQHLELTRDLAQRFNQRYSETFTVPEPMIAKAGGRIMSLQNPEQKMSKSDPSEQGILYLWDEPTVIRKKIMGAVTDSGDDVLAQEDKPGITNLLTIMSLATGQCIQELEGMFKGQGYGTFKEAVAESVIALLAPLQEQYKAFKGDKKMLKEVLKAGADVAQQKAYKVLRKVYRKVGFVEKE